MLNIFPPLQFHPDLLSKYKDYIDCLDHCIENLFKKGRFFFKNWSLHEVGEIQTFPDRIISLFLPFTYANEEILTKEKKEKLKEYKIKYTEHRIEFLEKYLELLKENATENDVLDLLLEYEVSGFNGVRKMTENEKWLKKELNKI